MLKNQQSPVVKKAFAYITRGKDILVFTQPEFPGAGIQVPKGTVEEGENLQEAVLREINEETGINIDRLQIKAYLGSCNYDMQDFGKNEIQERHFFWIKVTGKLKDTWSCEETGGQQNIKGIVYNYFWLNKNLAKDKLIANHGDFISFIENKPTQNDISL